MTTLPESFVWVDIKLFEWSEPCLLVVGTAAQSDIVGIEHVSHWNNHK